MKSTETDYRLSELLTRREAAEFMNESPSNVYYWAITNKIKSVTRGEFTFLVKADCERFMAERL